jgi:hypothetical protein
MTERIVVLALAAVIAIVGCTPSNAPDAAPSATPSDLPSAASTIAPSPTPTPDSRVIDASPDELVLTVEEMGLEDTFYLTDSFEYSNEDQLYGAPDWETKERWREELEASGRIAEWFYIYSPNATNPVRTLQFGFEFFQQAANWPYPADLSDVSNSSPIHLLELELGDRGILYHGSYGEGRPYTIGVDILYRNLKINIVISIPGDSTSEEIEEYIDWLSDIAFTQILKIEASPLSDEFVGYW